MLPGKDRTATPKYALGIKIILRNSRHGRNDENRVDYLFNNGKVSPSLGFSDGSDGKESTCNAGDLGLIPGLGQFLRGGHGNPLQYSCLENPQGQRSLEGYSPWGHKESDMTEHLQHVSLSAGEECD